MLPALLLAVVFMPMLAEARIAAIHDRALRAIGAAEPADDVYGWMQVAYPACFIAMTAEAWWRGADLDRAFGFGAAVFLLAKGLKYWAIWALGVRWTFRVLVPPGSARTTRGPYRFLTHPNYVAVMAELVATALMAHAPVAGVAAVAGFGLLIAARIRVEERALGTLEP